MKTTLVASPTTRLQAWNGKFWFSILGAYVVLFFATAYCAFFLPETNPAPEKLVNQIATMADTETKTIALGVLREEADAYRRKKELTNTAFFIVLGSFLSFLSASAVLRSSPRSESSQETTLNDA